MKFFDNKELLAQKFPLVLIFDKIFFCAAVQDLRIPNFPKSSSKLKEGSTSDQGSQYRLNNKGIDLQLELY